MREDLQNPNLLFAGTEYGLFVTLDAGQHWLAFRNGMPNVRVDDLLIHPRDRDLIVGTHGRSIWILDDITPLEQLGDMSGGDVKLFTPRPAVQWTNDISLNRGDIPSKWWRGENPQGGTAISVWAKSDLGTGKLEFFQGNELVSTMDVDVKAGLNRFQWNMQMDRPNAGGQGAGRGGGRGGFGRGRGGFNAGVPFVSGGRGGFGGGLVDPGTYTVRLTVGDKILLTSVSVLEDVWMGTEK